MFQVSAQPPATVRLHAEPKAPTGSDDASAVSATAVAPSPHIVQTSGASPLRPNESGKGGRAGEARTSGTSPFHPNESGKGLAVHGFDSIQDNQNK